MGPRGAWAIGVTYQLLEDTLVELPLLGAAAMDPVVVVVEAVPVGAERLEALGVEVGDARWNERSVPATLAN